MELENTIINKRLQLLDNYKDFLNSTEKKLNLFLDQIGWNAKDTFTEKVFVYIKLIKNIYKIHILLKH